MNRAALRLASIAPSLTVALALHFATPSLAATFTVTTAADTGNGSLRWAIGMANAAAGTDSIAFGISGLTTIIPLSPLPALTQPVVVDGTTQPGFTGTPIVQITGGFAGNAADGLRVQGGNSTIRGLIINGFTTTGAAIVGGSGIRIEVLGGNVVEGNYLGVDAAGNAAVPNRWHGVSMLGGATRNRIGGTTPAQRNVISGNGGTAVVVVPSGAGAVGRNRIVGNYIGTNAAGTAAIPNGGNGIYVEAPDDTIGGSAPGEGNVLSGNTLPGVAAVNTSRTVIRGNRIGTNPAGTAAIPNGGGIVLFNAERTQIGGVNPGEGNLISGNLLRGIFIREPLSRYSRISGNWIGTDVTGLLPLGNALDGILVSASTDTIGGIAPGEANLIAFNGGAGVADSLRSGNVIRGNSIHSNGGLGIEIVPRGLTVNDSLDADNGANELQNFPLLDSVVVVPGATKIYGRLNSTPNRSFFVDFYRATECDASHFGEGRAWLGVQVVATDAAGNASFLYTAPTVLPATEFLSATATRTDAGSTSEFSQCLCLNDSDGDALPDCWETAGWGLDVNSDGVVELDLHARGARPDHKDLFVEVDAMQGYAPPAGAIPMVEAAFASVPNLYVNNPDGQPGIRLHTTLDDTTIAVQALPNDLGDLPPIKAQWFGTAAERAHPNRFHILRAKRMSHRYGLWARTFGTDDDTLASGIADLGDGAGGDDFLVTFGSTGPDGWNGLRDVPTHAGTYMHELGHTLGLRHGGVDDVQYKPNYYSVMNYTWQRPKSWQAPGSWRLDYSLDSLPHLNEFSLDEPSGLRVPAGVWPVIVTVPYVDSAGVRRQARFSPGAPVDWSGNGTTDEPAVIADVNNFFPPGTTSLGDFLLGARDWQRLRYDFRKSPAFSLSSAPGPSASLNAEIPGELTPEMDRWIDSWPAPVPTGHFEMDGQLDASANLVASNAGLTLHARYVAGQLYVATQSAPTQLADVVVLVATDPSSPIAAPLAKAGQAGAWHAVLANPLAGGTHWSNPDGAALSMVAVDTAQALLEGVVDVELLTGVAPEQLYVAVGRYATGPGGALIAQAPAGNGDGNLDGSEYHALFASAGAPSSAAAAGRLWLSAASPNPASGPTRLRLTMPRAGHVVAQVEDVAGRTVARLHKGPLAAGTHELAWDPRGRGTRHAPGVYFVVVRAAGETVSRRVIVLE